MSDKWSFTTDKPIYVQIVEGVKKRIVSGSIKPGEKMQSVRELASEAEVNPNTVQRALMELEGQGLINTQRTTGKYVTEDNELIQRIKSEIANEKIKEFLNNMKHIGYTKEEIIETLKLYKEV